jgi:flagellar basal-body rod protein FlgG
MMINGKGFFPVQQPNGEIAYTRAGAFHLDAQGRLQLANGAQLVPPITVPINSASFTVTPQGEVKVTLPTGGETTIGQIQLVTFQNEQGLSAQGDGLYKPTLASGAPVQGVPGENGTGFVEQNALEGSNVNVANSMVDMIATQRAYEMGTKIMGVADQMWGATVNIK